MKTGIKSLKKKGYKEQVIHATGDTIFELEMALSDKIRVVDFAIGGIVTQVPAIDGVPIIETPDDRMYSSITVYDGKTEGQTVGGYVKGEGALEANFIIVGRKTPIAVTKQDVMRIFDPLTNQDANAWSMDYRRYHDLWVLENKKDSIFVNFKDANPAG